MGWKITYWTNQKKFYAFTATILFTSIKEEIKRGTMGFSLPRLKRIHVYKYRKGFWDKHPDATWHYTLAHELAHAINYQLGKLSNWDHPTEKEIDAMAISFLLPKYIPEKLRDNK